MADEIVADLELIPCSQCGADMDARKQMCNRCWGGRDLKAKMAWYKAGGRRTVGRHGGIGGKR